MMKKAVLVGTSHSIQRNDSEFKSYIEELCNEHNICAIAEEIDNECTSIASGVAKQLDIAYKIIEPTPEESIGLCIEQPKKIEYDLMSKYDLSDWPQYPSAGNLPSIVYNDYYERLQFTYRKREYDWLVRIQSLNIWPVLIICGKDHVEPFSKLLISSKIDLEPELILSY